MMPPFKIATRSRAAAVTLAALLGLGGCSFIPEYERPAAPVAAAFPAAEDADAAADAPAAADLPWQQFVQDGELRQVVQLALDNNRDLRVAVQRIEQARAAYQIRSADRLPTLAASASASRSQPNPSGPGVNSVYSVGLGVAGWELDFFGRVAALKDAALADFLATAEARKAAQISLVASVITGWLQLKTDTELLALTERTLATREQSLALMRLRFDSGVSSALDLRQAESLVASARAARADQRRRRAQDINLLTLLAGAAVPPEWIPVAAAAGARSQADSIDVAPVSGLPEFARVPAGLPSDLLLRRPDVRAAEQELIAANANIGAARASFFPRITLTASLGRVSADLDGLFGSGGNKAWSLGPSVSLPIFDGGRNRANLEAARAAREITIAQYEKAIQVAFREAADALVARTALVEQLDALQQQLVAERDRVQLADLRYRGGVASFLDLLDAERSLFAVEQAQAQVQLAQRLGEVQLYKALGGGWSESDGDAVR